MNTHCKCDHLFKITIFTNNKMFCKTYGQPFEFLIERYPNLTLGDLNRINDITPIRHYPDGQDDTYIEIIIERKER